jgi:hypothetical protein
MADSVQFILDRLAHTFRAMETLAIFNGDEIASIVKKRTDFEYVLKRRQLTPGDFYNYIQYEINLEKLRILRCSKDMQVHAKKIKTEEEGGKKHAAIGVANIKDRQNAIRNLAAANVRHIQSIFERAIRRFPNELDFVMDYISFLKDEMTPAPQAVKGGKGKKQGHEQYLVVANKSNSGTLNEVFGRALSLHPRHEKLWVMAAMHEIELNNNVHAARTLMQRALRVNKISHLLWKHYFELELWHALRLRERRRILMKPKLDSKGNIVEYVLKGSKSEAELKEEEEGYLLGAPVVVFKHALKAVNEQDFACELLQLVSTNCADDDREEASNSGGVRVESLSTVIRTAILDHFSADNSNDNKTKGKKDGDSLLSLWKNFLRASMWDESENTDDEEDDDEDEQSSSSSNSRKRKASSSTKPSSIQKKVINSCSTRISSFTSVLNEAYAHVDNRVTPSAFLAMAQTEASILLSSQRNYLSSVLDESSSKTPNKRQTKGNVKGKTSANGMFESVLNALQDFDKAFKTIIETANANAISASTVTITEDATTMLFEFERYIFEEIINSESNSNSKSSETAVGAGAGVGVAVNKVIHWFANISKQLKNKPFKKGDSDSVRTIDTISSLFNAVVESIKGTREEDEDEEVEVDDKLVNLAGIFAQLSDMLVTTNEGFEALMAAIEIMSSNFEKKAKAKASVDAAGLAFTNALVSHYCFIDGRGEIAAAYLGWVHRQYTNTTTDNATTGLSILQSVHNFIQKKVMSLPTLVSNGGMHVYYTAAMEMALQECMRLSGAVIDVKAKVDPKGKSTSASNSDELKGLYAFMRTCGDQGLTLSNTSKGEMKRIWDLREEVEVLAKNHKELNAIKWRRSRF